MVASTMENKIFRNVSLIFQFSPSKHLEGTQGRNRHYNIIIYNPLSNVENFSFLSEQQHVLMIFSQSTLLHALNSAKGYTI